MNPTDHLAEAVATALNTQFPYAAHHVTRDADDLRVDPQELHPAFCGSFDWHSSVHMQASAIRLLDGALDGQSPSATSRQRLIDVLDQRLTTDNIQREIAYLATDPVYERPYGWAWAAQLAATAERSPLARENGWADAVRSLGERVLDKLAEWLPRVAYPVRHGEHSNTAFAMLLARHAALSLQRPEVVRAIDASAVSWYSGDHDAPTAYEPSGSDFLSPSLCEAALMAQSAPDGFAGWLAGFLPNLGADGDPLLRPTQVLDESDGKAVHLHGLALSRSWLLRDLAPYAAPDRRERIDAAATAMLANAREAAVTGDFMSTHWLISFLILAEHGLP